MAGFSDETKDWSKRAENNEKPFARIYDHGTLVVSLVRDIDHNITPSVAGAGSLCWRAVDTIRARRIKITAHPIKGRIKLDEREPGVENNTLRTELRIPQPHPDSDVFTDVDHSCRFNVDNEGYEEVETTCGSLKEPLVSRFFAATPGAPKAAYTQLDHIPPVDVLVVSALKDERDAMLRIGGRYCQWATARDTADLEFHWSTIAAGTSESRVFVIARAVDMGETDAAAVASRLIANLSRPRPPRLLVMTGICAGHPDKTSLGDVVVAERVFKFDEGKREVVKRSDHGESETTVFHDLRTFNLRPNLKLAIEEFGASWRCSVIVDRPKSYAHQKNWLLWKLYEHEQQAAPYPANLAERKDECRDWRSVTSMAETEGLITINHKVELTGKGRDRVKRMRAMNIDGCPKDPILPSVLVGAMGTSAMVHKDRELFHSLQRLLRKIVALEMEAAAIANVADQNQIPCLIVKSVVDHADMEKNDNFRDYACEVSAEFVISFLNERGRTVGI